MKIRNFNIRSTILALFLTSVAGCGGGSGSGQEAESPQQAANRPPSLYANTPSAMEENRAEIGSIIFSDPDGDPLTLTISGEDGSLIVISSGELLSFIAAPDFELPKDSNEDNFYEFRITVSDGNLSASQDFEIRILDVEEQKWDQVLYDDGKLE